MLKPGDTVVYRHHVCTVSKVRKGYYEGKDYFELHALFENSLKLFVACDAAEGPAIRPVMGEGEMLALIDSIAEAPLVGEGDPLPANATMQERYAKSSYDTYLKTFSPDDLASIIHSAHARTVKRQQEGHRGMAVDKKYLDLAEGLLADELSVALGVPRDEAQEFLADRIKASASRRR